MKKLLPTSLEYALLGLVHMQPQTGYDLRKIFESTPMGLYSSSPGAIYPALKRLEQQGLIEGEVAAQDTMRPKRVYSATPIGVDILREWVSRAILTEDLLRKDNELMLRFALMGTVVDNNVTRRFLEQMLQALESYIPELEEILTTMPKSGPPHGRLALSSGIQAYKARRRWAREALRQFPQAGKKRRKK